MQRCFATSEAGTAPVLTCGRLPEMCRAGGQARALRRRLVRRCLPRPMPSRAACLTAEERETRISTCGHTRRGRARLTCLRAAGGRPWSWGREGTARADVRVDVVLSKQVKAVAALEELLVDDSAHARHCRLELLERIGRRQLPPWGMAPVGSCKFEAERLDTCVHVRERERRMRLSTQRRFTARWAWRTRAQQLARGRGAEGSHRTNVIGDPSAVDWLPTVATSERLVAPTAHVVEDCILGHALSTIAASHEEAVQDRVDAIEGGVEGAVTVEWYDQLTRGTQFGCQAVQGVVDGVKGHILWGERKSRLRRRKLVHSNKQRIATTHT